MTEVILAPELEKRANVEAERSHHGDLSAVIAAALAQFLDVQDGARTLAGYDGSEDPQEVRLARAITGFGVPIEQIQAIAGTLMTAAGLVPQHRHPESVHQHLRTVVDWVTASSDHGAGCVLVSTQAASGDAGAQADGVVGYARGWLEASGKHGLTGRLDQYFSDRNPEYATDPFDPKARDELGLDVALDDLTGMVTIELVSHAWGDARQTLHDLRLEDGVVLARGAAAGKSVRAAHYALSFSTVTTPG